VSPSVERRSLADIQPAAAEIRGGKKEEEEEEDR